MPAITKKQKGFTLIELMVAVSIFIVVMTISMGSIISVFDANRKSRSLKTVLNNLNLAVESMSKEMRFGKNYHCGSVNDTGTSALDCSGGNVRVNFLSSGGVQISYRFIGATIEKQVGSGDYIAVTAPEIVIDDLVFYARGAGNSDFLQPKVLVKIKSHTGTGTGQSDFTLQTLVSQRTLDI